MLSVQNADALMLFPEGFIAIVAVPLGLILDKYQRSTKERLLMLASACLLLPMSYIMLAYGFYIENPISNNTGDLNTPDYTDIQSNKITIISPTLSMCVIGIAYSISNCLYWSSVLEIFPKDRNHLAAANGLLAGSVNILPSVVSPFLVFISTFDSKESNISVRFPIHLLSGLGVCSSLFALLASLYMNPSLIPSPVIEDSTGAIELEKIEINVFEK
jgi:MFS family permease